MSKKDRIPHLCELWQAPGVPERKEILLRIPEVLECGDNDGLRLTVALMKQDLCQHKYVSQIGLLQRTAGGLVRRFSGLSFTHETEIMNIFLNVQGDCVPRGKATKLKRKKSNNSKQAPSIYSLIPAPTEKRAASL